MSAQWMLTDESVLEFESQAGSFKPGITGELWHDVLGVKPDSSLVEIKAAFRREMMAYHSDRVATLGRKLQELAERESKRINLAYEQARKAKL